MIAYKEGYRFQLSSTYSEMTGIIPPKAIRTYWVELDSDGKLTLYKGYAWNGADFPAINDATTIAASAEHDAFYQMIRLGHLSTDYKRLADKRLRERMREAGAGMIRSAYFELAVMIGGGHAIDPNAERKVRYAP